MKFHGIDMQGKYLIEESADPTWGASDDRRIVRNTANGRILLGTSSGWDELVLAGQGLPPDLETTLDGVYHPLNGDVAESFIASSYTGDAGGHFRITSPWLKLSDNIPLAVGNSAGIQVELDSPSSDIDDPSIYYLVNADPALSGWYLNDESVTTSLIATQDWVNSSISSSETSSWSDDEIDQRFVRQSVMGDITTNDTWEDWDGLTAATAVDRYYYTIPENYAGFVRTSNWSMTGPSGTAIYSTSANVISTVVERDASGDIYCEILHGTATSAQYADLAENYTCDPDLVIGTVVGVMESSEYEVDPYGTNMNGCIGVVSETPAFLMNSECEGRAIALTGKVPVRVVGEINKGDFLVPCPVGLARKGNPFNSVDVSNKFAISLETNLHPDEKMVECIVK